MTSRLEEQFNYLQATITSGVKSDAAFWRNYFQTCLLAHEEFHVSSGHTYALAAFENIEKALGFVHNNKPEFLLYVARIFEYNGVIEKAADVYRQIITEFPTNKLLMTALMRASILLMKIDMIDTALSYMQRVLDDPPDPYSEPDILVFLGNLYEIVNTKDSKKLSKEAFRQAYKKLFREGRLRRKKKAGNNVVNEETKIENYSQTTSIPKSPNGFHNEVNTELISFKTWKNDCQTWKEIGDKCLGNHDYSFALFMYTRALWTSKGQSDGYLWLTIADLHNLVLNSPEAIQAASTAYSILPDNLEIRSRLGRWDTENWGYHIKYEEDTATQVQAILRGNWGRQKARQHKERILRIRKERNKAATTIQRFVRGMQARRKVKQLRHQLYLEWQRYQLELLRYNSAVIIQCVFRIVHAKAITAAMRRNKNAAIKIQCSFRQAAARWLLQDLRKEKLERDMQNGAICFQRIYRGHKGRIKATLARIQCNAATCIQCSYRCYRSKVRCATMKVQYIGSTQIQKVFRGYKTRMKYKTIRQYSACIIQTIYRGYVARTSYPCFRESFLRNKHKIENIDIINQKIMKSHKTRRNGENTVDTTEDSNDKPEVECANSPRACSSDKDQWRNPQRRHLMNIGLLDNKQLKSEDWVGDDLMSSRHVKTPEASQILVQALRSNQINRIWVNNWEIDDSCMEQIEKALHTNESLTELAIGKQATISEDAMRSFAEVLRCHNFRIRKLYFNNLANLGDSGSIPILRCIGDFFFGRYAKLEELSLQNVGLGNQACIKMSEGLEINTKLRILRMGRNKIGNQGASAIGKALRENVTLEQLDLDNNRIGSEGATHLANALLQNETSSLHHLRLPGNLIENKGALRLEKITGFCTVTLQCNPIQASVIKRIKNTGQKVKFRQKQENGKENELPPINSPKTTHEVTIKGPPFTMPTPLDSQIEHAHFRKLRRFNPRPYKEIVRVFNKGLKQRT